MQLIIADPSKGRCYRIDLDEEKKAFLIGKKIGDLIEGDFVGLNGYVLKITGGSDKSGFPMVPYIEGTGLKRVLLKAGSVGFRKKRRRDKVKKHRKRGVKWNHKALRLRKTVRGNTVSEDISQVNVVIVRKGERDIEEILQVGKTQGEGQ